MNFTKLKRYLHKGASFLLAGTLFLGNCFTTYATVDREAEAVARQNIPVETNDIENWPDGPVTSAEAAILMEANTGTILYGKNIHQKSYPASTTKILTTLIAAETADMNDVVSFSNEAVFSIERSSSNMGMDVGETLTMEQCLYGILVYSANETANAVAEHIGGTIDDFIVMMNQKAAEIGCTESHFMNPHGLHDENHYTTPYDFALIAKEFFNNEMLCKMSSTINYVIEPTATQPDHMDLWSKNKLLPGKTYAYDYLVGSKTGYTTDAHSTLVSCAQKDGMKLICVVMKEDSPAQFEDTVALFDYGFANFQCLKVADYETAYTPNGNDFFTTSSDIFGSSKPIMTLNESDYIVLPNTAVFSDTESTLTYDETENSSIATVNYTYKGVNVGSATIELESAAETTYDFDGPVVSNKPAEEETENTGKIIFLNVVKIILIICGLAALFIFGVFLRAFLHNYYFGRKRRRRRIRLTPSQELTRRRKQIKQNNKRRRRSKRRLRERRRNNWDI
ncbi:MAG: D-alanyl-D-alanine carboxypeptidase [Lachnospiraceae bacterium]|nr:D-alanyl-D-alanine carboxypeptidase [Lachnospiraceae bacterium]